MSIEWDEPEWDHDLEADNASTWVTSDVEAQAALRALQEVQRKVNRVEALVAHEQDQIALWRDSHMAGLNARREYLVECVTRWYRNMLGTGKLKGSVSFPSGNIKVVKGRKSVVFEDPDRFVVWVADEYPDLDFVQVVVTPAKTAVAAAIRGGGMVVQGDMVVDVVTGQVVPGVRQQVGEDRIDVSIVGGEDDE